MYLTLIILTYNEAQQIKRCILSAEEIAKNIFIVDSYSTDETEKIVKSLGAKFCQHKWENNHAKQFNWALDNLPIQTDWVMRLDADEYLLPELVLEIKNKLSALPTDITGVYLKRRVYFMNRWIKNGGYYPTYLLRLWKKEHGKYEERWMDEHVRLFSGKAVSFEQDFVDDNLNNLSWWTEKHNNYSTREAIDLLNTRYHFGSAKSLTASINDAQDKRKRWLKEKVYIKIPLFIRPFFYFTYRYFIKLGFLDGKQGLIWHFLQGFWYRFLVDAKIYQIESLAKKDNKTIPEVIKEHYNIDLMS